MFCFSFVISFAGFQEWPGGRVPGNPLGLQVPINHRPSPWEAMINLTTDDMKTVPVLPLCWRTRLLHPLYPYLKCVCVCVCVCVRVRA